MLFIGILISLPTHAAEVRKPVNAQELKQETVALGDNRFIIFSGTPDNNGQFGYTADLIKIEGGMPHYAPLFIEDYDVDSNTARLSYGVAFLCLSYHFDKPTNTFTYTGFDPDTNTRLQLTYKLDTDIFRLQEVESQKTPLCAKEPCTPLPPKTIFKAPTNAQTH